MRMRIRWFSALVGAVLFCACTEQPPPADCKASQSPPVAQAGPDQTIKPGALVTLEGAASTVPGEQGRYHWTLSNVPSGSKAGLSDVSSRTPTFTADLPGLYVATLVVSDSCQQSSPDTVLVKAEQPVPPENQRPVARPGSSRQVELGLPVELDGSASSDPEDSALTYSWSFASVPSGSAAVLSQPTSAKPSFTPDLVGAYIVRLVVSDGKLESEPVFITLTGKNTGPAAPVARPGASRTVLSRRPVTLDGSASSAASGEPLTYSWTFVSVPTGSTAAFSDATLVKPTFTPDMDGDYVVQLIVSDGLHPSAPATLTLTAQNRAPVANAGADLIVSVGSAATPKGQGSDDNGDTLTFTWTLTRKPTGSASTLSGGNTPTPSLRPDLEGTYELSLVVDDGRATSPADTVVLTAERPTTHGLGHRVLDAEYSKSLDRVVMVAADPNTLYVYDPATHTEKSVALPLAPTAVSVAPDGKFAAVGHDAYISYVDLSTPALLKSIPVSADAFDVVLAGNGYAYVFPRVDQWVGIHSIEIATGKESLGSSYSIRAGTRARLHPGGTAMYGADNGLSPDDIERYDISTGIAKVAYDSPYHGNYYMCGDLWFSEDGARIFTRCGNTFRASSVRSEDMVYAGALSGASAIHHLTHSTAANRIALVQESYGTSEVGKQVRLYTPDFLNFDQAIPLPPFKVNATEYASYGRFVFYSAAGDRLIVVVQAAASSGMLNDYGIVTF
ncbi:hypothetical protein JRI60_20925 [Archangium violaceum]|uniref:PKD domain-containing protein n=1 Tax=Archangium violaceum TaxID=83451 RepID=UPI00194EA8CB|nr:PKD domain-containing protein [Archangium violaceum]QRO01308.1 hypothetical protein JRI60_20925 [Archangium violaceum]